jgi:CrcB protein
MPTQIIYIAVFGALGCLSRYFLSGAVYGILGRGFPYGTFVVNLIGAYAIGLVMELGIRSAIISPNLRMGIAIGFLGGLTTFSTFSYETFRLLEDGEFLVASMNVFLSVLVCLAFTWLGIQTARYL